jgi:hypothetical protein
MKPILKHLLMAAIEYSSAGLKITQCRCDYTAAHADHVTLQPILSVVFQQSKWKNVFFTSIMNVHCPTLPGSSFSLNLLE